MLAVMGISLFVTIAAMTVILAITAGLYARGRSLRVLLAGLGIVLLPLAMFLTEMTTLLVNGIASLIAWAQRTGWTTSMTWGVSLAGISILLLIASGFVPKKERNAEPKPAKAQQPKSAANTKPAIGSPKRAQPAQSEAKPQAKAQPVDEELDEIEAILKKRGIN